jgi:Pvc16 N-terminal domain
MQDLTIVTDALLKIINDALTNSPLYGQAGPPFSLNVTGQHPETPNGGGHDCELNLYLFHIGTDKYLANQFWTQASQRGGKQPVAFEPLALDLWYMLSAQSKISYTQEQLVLSIAMQALHENAKFTLNTPTPGPNPVTPSEATLVLEAPTFDEMSRLWQALAIPLRTTAQYRVSVAFLTPTDAPPADEPGVTDINLAATPSAPSTDASVPHLLATRRAVSYTTPSSTVIFPQCPAATAPAPSGVGGQVVSLDGFGVQDSDHVLLVSFDAAGNPTETDVTATWKQPITPPYPAPPANGVPFLLRPPEGTAVAPGRHELLVTRPSLPGFRSNAVPLDIAPWINPAGGPLLNHDGNQIYTMVVRNVPEAGAALRVGSMQLTRIADGAAPGPGQWQCSGGSQISFTAPAGTPPGQHQIGLRAGDVEADPALWAVV